MGSKDTSDPPGGLSEFSEPGAPDHQVPDLDIAPAPPVSGRRLQRVAPVDAGFELVGLASGFELEPVAEAPKDDDGPWPRGRTPHLDQLPLSEERIQALAGYGKAPESVFFAPLYTWQVVKRRPTLRRGLAEAEARLAAAEAERDRQFSAMISQHLADIEANDRLERLVAPWRAEQETRNTQDLALAQQNASAAEQVAGVDAELDALLSEEGVILKQRVEADAARDRADTEAQRASAQHKRVQIEIRNLLEAARRVVGPQGGALPPDYASKLAPLETREREAKALADSAQGLLSERTASVAALDQTLRQLSGKRAKLDKQKRALLASTKGPLQAASRALVSAEQRLNEALRNLAAAVLDLPGQIPVSRRVREGIQRSDREVEAALLSREEHQAALRAYDSTLFTRGFSLAMATLAALVAGLICLMV